MVAIKGILTSSCSIHNSRNEDEDGADVRCPPLWTDGRSSQSNILYPPFRAVLIGDLDSEAPLSGVIEWESIVAI